jgi:cytoskeletal protein CcmA (bactofilin family)
MLGIFQQKRPRYGEDPNFVPNTVIGEGVTMMGGILKGVNSVMISGLVFGDINVDGEVIVTETGYVKGNIISTFAVVAGIVEGNLQLSSYASLKSTASVTGDINCTAISIEDGAVFSGACNMIVKSGALNKKLKKINETAITMQDDKAKLIGTAEFPAEAGLPGEGYEVLEEVGDYGESPGKETEPAEAIPAAEDEAEWHSLDFELEEETEQDTEEDEEAVTDSESEAAAEESIEETSEEEEPEKEEAAEDIEARV